MQTFKSEISGEINKYDFVLVNNNGWFTLGFLYKETSTTVQFLIMDYMVDRSERGVFNPRKPYVGFIKKFYPRGGDVSKFKVTKYSPDLLSEENKEKYDKAVRLVDMIKSHERQ